MGSSASKVDSYEYNLKSEYKVPKPANQVPISAGDVAKIIKEHFESFLSAISSIPECNKGKMIDQEMSDIVRQFFSLSSSVLEFYNEIESSLDTASDGQLNLRVAVELVKAGSGDGANRSEKYKLPLEKLEKFKNSGDPFTGMFEKRKKVQQETEKLLEKVKLYQKKIKKQQKRAKIARIAVAVVGLTIIVSIIACQALAVSGVLLAEPGIIELLRNAFAATISACAVLDSLCKNYCDGLTRQQDLVSPIYFHCMIEINNFEDIKTEAEKAANLLQSLKRGADFTLEGEENVKIGFKEIEKKMDKYAESLKDLGKCVEKCRENLKKGREDIKKKLFPTE